MKTPGTSRLVTALVVALLALIVVRSLIGALWGVLSFFVFLFVVISVLDAATSRRSQAGKIAWIAVILLVPGLGAVAYWLLARED